ncbi:ABC transporter permease [Luteimonas sp. A501]
MTRLQTGRFGQFLAGPFRVFGPDRSLTAQLAWRDIIGRYRGANFGLFWSLIGPLMMLAIYALAFGHILGSRWVRPEGEGANFAIVLFLGIIVHGFFAECISRAPGLMQANANYVKKVIFPLPVLPWAIVWSALFHMAMNMLVFVVLAALVYGEFSWYIFLFPVVIAPLVMLTIAVSWVTASLGVYLRDINQAIPVVVTGMFFLSSAIIPLDSVPEKYRLVFHLNPLTFFIDQARNVALWQVLPDWQGLAAYAVGGLVAMYLAYAWFRLTSRGFADVL